MLVFYLVCSFKADAGGGMRRVHAAFAGDDDEPPPQPLVQHHHRGNTNRINSLTYALALSFTH